MSDDATQEARPTHCLECCGCKHLFRAWRLAFHPAKVFLAFLGIFGTYLSGRVLDGVWSTSSTPVVTTIGGVTELDFFARGGGRAGTAEWIKEQETAKNASRTGAFALLLRHGRTTANNIAHAAINLSPSAVLGAVATGLMGLVWLPAIHPLYAILFAVINLFIWGLFGGAVCRMIALHATRDERITIGEAMKFARKKLLSFFAAPIMPIGIVIFVGAALFLGGLVGLIPAVGEVLVGILFFLGLIAGFVLAFVFIGAVAGACMTFPTIAVEGSDAFDALSRTFSYVYQRPWRTALYGLLSIGYCSVCFLFAKFFIRLMLWSAHLFAGVSMNWGRAFTSGGGEDTGKLHAIWQAPSLWGDSPFIGGFNEYTLSGASWFAQFLIKAWIYGVWGLLAALMVTLFYSASTQIYLLLRRDVDATDLEEVYLEDVEDEAAPAPAASGQPAGQPTASGTSLPIVGQN